MIIDISEHQAPSAINYDEFVKGLELVIVRVQYGSNYIDKHYKTHIAELQRRGVPVAVYAWVRGVSNSDMEVEAADFYNRAKEFNPTFWFLDVEEQTMADMRGGCISFINKMRVLGAKKVGVYIAHHLYTKFNLDMSKADAVWIPHYGLNNGTINSKPEYPCDLHQFTSVGRHSGYNGNLDLNVLTGSKPLSYFTGASAPTPQPQPPVQSGWVRKAQTGTFYPNTVIKIRNQPSTKGGDTGLTYGPPEWVIYDSYVVNEGYVWLSWIGTSGQRRYMACREEGKELWGRIV